MNGMSVDWLRIWCVEKDTWIFLNYFKKIFYVQYLVSTNLGVGGSVKRDQCSSTVTEINTRNICQILPTTCRYIFLFFFGFFLFVFWSIFAFWYSYTQISSIPQSSSHPTTCPSKPAHVNSVPSDHLTPCQAIVHPYPRRRCQLTCYRTCRVPRSWLETESPPSKPPPISSTLYTLFQHSSRTVPHRFIIICCPDCNQTSVTAFHLLPFTLSRHSFFRFLSSFLWPFSVVFPYRVAPIASSSSLFTFHRRLPSLFSLDTSNRIQPLTAHHLFRRRWNSSISALLPHVVFYCTRCHRIFFQLSHLLFTFTSSCISFLCHTAFRSATHVPTQIAPRLSFFSFISFV